METILIVDDDAHIREILRYKLVEAGYKTIEAGNGSEAIEQFTNLAPDLLILDIMMPPKDMLNATLHHLQGRQSKQIKLNETHWFQMTNVLPF